MTTSPLPWHVGSSAAAEGLTLYTHDGDSPRGRIIGFMRRPEDAAHIVRVVNADHAAEHPSGRTVPELEATILDLQWWVRASERRRRIADVLANHFRELAKDGEFDEFGTGRLKLMFDRMIAALSGVTDPVLLGIADYPDVIEQVGQVLTSQDTADRHRRPPDLGAALDALAQVPDFEVRLEDDDA